MAIFVSDAIIQAMKTIIRNIDAVVSGRIVRKDIVIEDGFFSSAGTGSADKIIDGTDLLAVPGFIDTHIHGIGGSGTEDGTSEAILNMSATLAQAGVTSFFPTIYTDTMPRILLDEKAITEASGKENGAEIAGIHLEGPFISQNRIGAQNPAGRLDPDEKVFMGMLDAGKGLVKAMTIAPELPGTEEIARLSRKNGVVLLMGHTDAGYEEAVHGMEIGIRHATHLFNAMSGFQHRKPGVVGCALMNDAMSAEIIADGKHVNPEIVRYLIKSKGPDKIAVITDSLRPTMQKDGVKTANGVEVEMGDGLWVTKGRPELIQGSALTMHKAFVNLVSWGIPITEASQVTSTTPARIYGLSDRGEIMPGKRADLVVMDRNLGIRFTIIKGEISCGTAN